MTHLKDFLISPDISVKEAIIKINKTGKKVVFVVDEDKKLLGLFSDGDLRRYILINGNLLQPVSEAMNKNPTVFMNVSSEQLKQQIGKNVMIVYPIVDEKKRLLDALFWIDIKDEIKTLPRLSLPSTISTVIMAGGLGRRLYPYTKVLPKALIPIGEQPICSHVIDSFKKYGCKKFNMVLNHKKNMIKAYYSEEEKDYKINYFEEKEFLGTAGGLSLLKGKIKHSFFVSNCDILVETDYACIYKFHKKEKNLITVVGALKDVEVPYGVLEMCPEKKLTTILEKPKFSFLTNVGIYLLEPEVLDDLNENEFIHMTDLISKYISEGKKVGVFPILGEDWLDMGQIEEMKQMTAILEKKMQEKKEN